MTLQQFDELVLGLPDPLVLLEGKRNIPEDYRLKARNVAAMLAGRYINMKFRSGNAEGADEAFSKGIVSIDPGRLQIIAPYRSHRTSSRYSGVVYDSPESFGPQVTEDAVSLSIEASPKYRALLESRGSADKLKWKSIYLIRDAMKVMISSPGFPVPVAALFYVDLKDPDSGGTGHTVRMCKQRNIPVVFQNEWEKWPV